MSKLTHSRTLQCGHHLLDLSHPQVMGVLNVTPDSFYDGGLLYSQEKLNLDLALAAAERLVQEGAAIVDVGGESTRPGATPVTEQEEQDRVLPLVEAISQRLDVVISVDSSSPMVMRESAVLGAGMLNDIRALSREGALPAARDTGLPICLMHMQGEPGMMQQNPTYKNVTDEVGEYLRQRVRDCIATGISEDRLLLDPGFGFGKTVEHNLQLLRELSKLQTMGYPLLVGLSRKSLIGVLLQQDTEQRLPGSLALASLAVANGASIVRAHDVAATWDAIRIAHAVSQVLT